MLITCELNKKKKKGHSWKKLSPDERGKWEAEAVAAQAQHRAMYPDWRFRPGANALAKLKVKDGGTALHRRSARVKEPPDEKPGTEFLNQGRKGKEKGKGRNRTSARMLSLEEMRCAKIADLVADGIQGEELEVAVKQWESERKMGKPRSKRPRLSRADNPSPHTPVELSPGSWDNHSPPMMQVSPTAHGDVHDRWDSISVPMPSGTNAATTSFDTSQQHLSWQDAENQRRMEELQEPNSWWRDSRSAEVEPSTFGYEHDQLASGITDMGYENCGGTHFDSGYVEVWISFPSPNLSFLHNSFGLVCIFRSIS